MTSIQANEPPKRLSQELRGLCNNFAKDVKGTSLIAESLLMNFDEAAESILALIDGTDSSADVPSTFQEAWHHEDPDERKLWRETI